MKVILLSISMLALTLSVNAQSKETTTPLKKEFKEVKKVEELKKSDKEEAEINQSKTPIKFSNVVIERSAIPYDSQELFAFEFKNSGDTPILIQNVQTSCGCTTASKPEEPIQPGKKGEISVKYDTKRVGDFTKTITVTTNVQPEPIILTIKGKVLPQEQKVEEAPKN